MKHGAVICTAILLLLLGATAPAFAQREQKDREQGKPEVRQQQPAKAAPQSHQEPAARPAPQSHQQGPSPRSTTTPYQTRVQPTNRRPAPPQEKPPTNYGSVYHGGVQATGPTYGGVHHSGVPQQRTQVRSGFGQSRARSWSTDHRSWAQRGGYNGYRIPDDRFRLYFGRQHYFRMFGLPMVFVGGYPRFQYDGYWVTLVDPWPEMWPANWYETDDVYLDYTDDGYYLYDNTRPGPGIAVTISF